PDPAVNDWTFIDNVPGSIPIDSLTLFLALPNGQIWVSGTGDAHPWLYTPAGTPQPSWRPTITSVSGPAFAGGPAFGAFTLSGVQLNGLTTGADFGDDNKMATNYPIVWLTDGAGHVTYGRTFNFDQMAPRPNWAGSALFTVPSDLA